MENEKQELELDSEKGLLSAGFIEIGRQIWAKGKEIHGRCDNCNFITELPFSAINRINQIVFWTCSICRTENSYSTNERILLRTKW